MNQATQKVSFELFHFFNQKSKLFLNSKRNLFVSPWLVFQGSDSLAYYLSFTLENVNFSMISIINWDGVEDRPCNLVFLCMYNVNWVVSCTFIALERTKWQHPVTISQSIVTKIVMKIFCYFYLAMDWKSVFSLFWKDIRVGY